MLQQETVKGSRDNLGNGKKFRYNLLRLSNYHYAIRRLKMLNFKKLEIAPSDNGKLPFQRPDFSSNHE